MKQIKIVGTGCPSCKKLYEYTEKAAKELGIEYKIEKVTDINEIIEMGIFITPAVVVDGVEKTSGVVPSVEAIKKLL